jgi:hypothetical protein
MLREMSKSFPASARKYDLYIATDEKLEIGRVLFNRNGRFVVRETYTREAWERARAVPPEEGPGRLLGVFPCDGQPRTVDELNFQGDTRNWPDNVNFFYGADYL